MGLGYGSDAINGQLVPVRTLDGYSPNAYGPIVNVGTAAVNTVPPSLGAGGGRIGGNSGTVASSSGDITNNSGGTNMAHADLAAANPWNFKVSPLPMAMVFLVVGLVGLRLIHWRG